LLLSLSIFGMNEYPDAMSSKNLEGDPYIGGRLLKENDCSLQANKKNIGSRNTGWKFHLQELVNPLSPKIMAHYV